MYNQKKTARELWGSLDRKYKKWRNWLLGFVLKKNNKVSEKEFTTPGMAKANIVEHGQGSKTEKFANGGSKLGPKKDMFTKNNREANLMENISKEVSNMNLCA